MPSFPKAKPPEPGYAETLPSYVIEPIKLALINLFETSGFFNHVSAMFPYPTNVQLDNYYPHIQMHTPNGSAESFTIKNKMMTLTLEIYYYAKHLQDQGYSSNEISHFIENAVYLIENTKSFNMTLNEKTICIGIKGVTDIALDFFVNGSYLISMGMVSIQVVFPVCVLQPYDDEDEE